MDKKRWIWIAVLVVFISAGLYAAYALVVQGPNQHSAGKEESLETAGVRVGDIEVVVSGWGEIVPASQIRLAFNDSGTVLEVLVDIGDQVKAGDVLAALQRDKTETELAAEIAAAELAVIQAQNALNDIQASAEISAAQALIELEDAQLAIEEGLNLDLEKALALQEVVYAQEAIANIEMLLYIYNSSPSEDDIYTAYASWLFKQEILDNLTKRVNQTILKSKGVKDERMREQLEEQLMQLTQQQTSQRLVVEDAIYRLNSMQDPADPLDITLVESQLKTACAVLVEAQKAYESLNAGPEPGDVAIAEARLSNAQTAYQHVKDGPDSKEMARLETELEKARLNLELLRAENTVVELTAPIAGTVTALNLNVGDRINLDSDTGASEGDNTDAESPLDIVEVLPFDLSSSEDEGDDFSITLADLSQPLLEIFLDETDYTRIALGYPVEINFDAFPEGVFTGTVVEISPILETVSAVNAVSVLVLLDAVPFTSPDPLPIGLSASAEVIAGRVTGAILVPVEALVEVGPGEYIVYVVEDNQLKQRGVSVGLIDFTSAEISEGLLEDEVVALNNGEETGN